MSESNHQKYLQFISDLSSLLGKVTEGDLLQFRSAARKGFSDLVPVIDGCLRMFRKNAEKLNRETETYGDQHQSSRSYRKHLFDLLRSKQRFPTNANLSEFATRILPGITKKRFDKMSRADIAGQIIEYIEQFPLPKRRQLEKLIREAVDRPQSAARLSKDNASFFEKWEQVIKGLSL